MAPTTTARETLKSLGGIRVVAAVLGVGETTVRNWQQIGRFPPRLFFPLRTLAAAKRVPLDERLFQSVRAADRPATRRTQWQHPNT